MPSTYAHYSFGKKVLSRLPAAIKPIIFDNREAYNIGLHGPDLLLYYKPFISNNVNAIGEEMHKTLAYDFFDLARSYISVRKDNCLKAYTFGFICHFILDSVCHKYINEKVNVSNISHAEIETSFDGVLMLEDNINYLKWNPTKHIVPNYGIMERVACLFPDVTPAKLYKCQRSMKIINGILTCSTKVKRKILISLLKITNKYDGFGGFIMKEIPNINCEDSNLKLFELYKEAIDEAVDLIVEYNSKLGSNDNLNERFNYDYE